jgi:hypothetical protein
MTEPLEAGVYRLPPGIARVAVTAVRIALPDLDTYTGKRISVTVE